MADYRIAPGYGFNDIRIIRTEDIGKEFPSTVPMPDMNTVMKFAAIEQDIADRTLDFYGATSYTLNVQPRNHKELRRWQRWFKQVLGSQHSNKVQHNIERRLVRRHAE